VVWAAGIAGATTGATAGTTAGATGTTAAAAPTAAGLDATLASANTTANAALPSASAPLTTAGVDGAGLTSAGASEGLNLAGGSTDAGLKYAGVRRVLQLIRFHLIMPTPLPEALLGLHLLLLQPLKTQCFPTLINFMLPIQ
jgi:hypothetical protein